MVKYLTVLGTALLMVACSNNGQTDTTAPVSSGPQAGATAQISAGSAEEIGPENPATSATLARLPDADAGDGAALQGVLAIDQTCVGLSTPDGFYVLAPTNAAISWTGDKLSLSDGTLAKLGATLNAGGSKAADPDSLTFVTDVPKSCDSFPIWITYSIQADITHSIRAE